MNLVSSFYQSEVVRTAIHGALHAVHSARADDPMLAHVRHLLVFFLVRAERWGEAMDQLIHVDGHVGALPWTLSEGMVTGVRIAIRDGMADRARRLLDRMLSAAEATGVWYSLVFATPEVIETLTASLGRLGSHDSIATQVLMRRRGLASPAIPPPLTERELSVLRLLPTMRSVDEIAEDLTVSPNTVKTHVRGIYSKLNVRSRRDAVLAAVARGLLHGDAVATPE